MSDQDDWDAGRRPGRTNLDSRPIWLRLQQEQLTEADIHLSNLAPRCDPPTHLFIAGMRSCLCGLFGTVGPAPANLTVTVDQATLDKVIPLPPPGGLTDEDVRRLEHPDEFPDGPDEPESPKRWRRR